MINQRKGFAGLVLHAGEIALRKMPITFFLYMVFSIGAGLSAAAVTYFKQIFFDSVEMSISGGALSSALTSGAVMGISLVAALLIKGAAELLDTNCFQKLQGYMGVALNQKASRIPAVAFEDNRFLDSINKAHKGLGSSGQVLSAFLSILFTQLAYLIFMGIYLYQAKPILLLLLLVSFLPSVVGAMIRYRLHKQMENKAAPYRRHYEYYGKCIYDREYAKETRMLGAFGYFRGLFTENIQMLSKLNWKTTKKSELTEIVLRFVMLIGYTGTLIAVFYFLIKGELGVGIFAAVLSSIDQMFDEMELMMRHNLGAITQQLGMTENYVDFLSMPERDGEMTDEIKGERVSLRGVSFRYPNGTQDSIRDVNLDIAIGETVAIVGENGAGKSTLVRLITGLYTPTRGTVLIDGKDISKYSLDSIRKSISAVFQKYQKYKMTLGDNVRISDPRGEESAYLALAKADFSLENKSLTDGMDTMLGKDFGGIDLSGGQWQRVAIARGFYRAHNMIVLDEPTAAIDPIEETKIYHKFAEISREKTAFIVTHRLGSVKIADRIIVMDKGMVVDVGTHDELMKRCNMYSFMYNVQAKWYK